MEAMFDFFSQFAPLSADARQLIATTIEYKEFKRKTLILSAGSYNRYLYVIKNGLVRAFVNANGEEITLSFWMENEFFGDSIAYINGEKATKSYEAIEDTEVYAVDIAKFRALFETSHELANFGRILAEKHILKTEKLKDCLRINTAEQKFEAFLENRPGLIARAKLKHIASFLAISPETLSRIRKNRLK